MRTRRAIPKPASSKLPEPDINVTPLVDVVLVLLIIFMVVTPKLAQNPIVNLPSAKAIDQKQSAHPIDVILKKDKTLLVEDAPVERASLPARIADLHRSEPDRGILLQADAALPYGEVRNTFADLQATGTRGVALKVLLKKQ